MRESFLIVYLVKKKKPQVLSLGILLKRDIDNNLTTKHDKRNDFN